MQTVSYYSFKGGVGRTVALLNTAWHLAERGHSVGLLDLDLEAPGLNHARLYKDTDEYKDGCWRSIDEQHKNSKKKSYGAPGFVNLLHHFTEKVIRPGGNVLDLYSKSGLGPGGRIRLMPAGCDQDDFNYQGFLQSFSWYEFYHQNKYEGRAFMEALVEAFQRTGCDYLLIDARTGHTDVAGITLFHLPDTVVFVTNLAEQSYKGVRDQLNALQIVNQECLSDGGSGHRKIDARTKPIEAIVVASPLPTGELAKRQEALMKMRECGIIVDVEVEQIPFISLGEGNQILSQQIQSNEAVGHQVLTAIDQSFRNLADEITRRNPFSKENLSEAGRILHAISLWRPAKAHLLAVYGDQNFQELDLEHDLVRDAAFADIRASLDALDVEGSSKSLRNLRQNINAKWETKQKTKISHKDVENYIESQEELIADYLSLSWAQILLNQFSAAANSACQAVSASKRADNKLYVWGYTLTEDRKKEEGQKEDAPPPTRRVPRIDPLLTGLAYMRHAEALSLTGKKKEALKECKKAIGVFEKNGSYPILHALARLQEGSLRLSTGESLAEVENIINDVRKSPAQLLSHEEGFLEASICELEAMCDLEAGLGKSASKKANQAILIYGQINDPVGETEATVIRARLQTPDPHRMRKAMDDLRMPIAAWQMALYRSQHQWICRPIDDPTEFVRNNFRNFTHEVMTGKILSFDPGIKKNTFSVVRLKRLIGYLTNSVNDLDVLSGIQIQSEVVRYLLIYLALSSHKNIQDYEHFEILKEQLKSIIISLPHSDKITDFKTAMDSLAVRIVDDLMHQRREEGLDQLRKECIALKKRAFAGKRRLWVANATVLENLLAAAMGEDIEGQLEIDLDDLSNWNWALEIAFIAHIQDTKVKEPWVKMSERLGTYLPAPMFKSEEFV